MKRTKNILKLLILSLSLFFGLSAYSYDAESMSQQVVQSGSYGYNGIDQLVSTDNTSVSLAHETTVTEPDSELIKEYTLWQTKALPQLYDDTAVFVFGINIVATKSGTDKPWTKGAKPNSKYDHLEANGKAKQTAHYDENGDVIGHVDWKNHGQGVASGHGHKFPDAGNPASGHGRGKPHIPNQDLPKDWQNPATGQIP